MGFGEFQKDKSVFSCHAYVLLSLAVPSEWRACLWKGYWKAEGSHFFPCIRHIWFAAEINPNENR
jgi:hypothetical protein